MGPRVEVAGLTLNAHPVEAHDPIALLIRAQLIEVVQPSQFVGIRKQPNQAMKRKDMDQQFVVLFGGKEADLVHFSKLLKATGFKAFNGPVERAAQTAIDAAQTGDHSLLNDGGKYQLPRTETEKIRLILG